MPKLIPIMLRASEEWKALIAEAASKLGYARGDRDMGIAAFIRQACTEKANKVLGRRPTQPVHVATKDKH